MKRIVLAAALCCLTLPAWAYAAGSLSIDPGILYTPNNVVPIATPVEIVPPPATWSPGPVYVAVEPFLLAIVNGVIIPLLLGWGLYLGQRFLNIKFSDSQRADLQTTLANAAGRVVAQLEPAAMKASIPITSPLIAAEVPKVELKAKQAIDYLGITPERVAEGIQGHIGRLQAPAASAPIVVPVIDAAGKGNA